jgi:hypothetical protein
VRVSYIGTFANTEAERGYEELSVFWEPAHSAIPSENLCLVLVPPLGLAIAISNP